MSRDRICAMRQIVGVSSAEALQEFNIPAKDEFPLPQPRAMRGNGPERLIRAYVREGGSMGKALPVKGS